MTAMESDMSNKIEHEHGDFPDIPKHPLDGPQPTD
jgi:hypothetical protein